TIVPPPDAMARLQRLQAAATTLAEDVPQMLAHPQASRGLEQALIEATIKRRFYRVIEERLDQPLYLPELCREIGTAERTLRACCHEHLGMGPKRYLLLSRMHLVRRALREGVPGNTTVTEIAMRY